MNCDSGRIHAPEPKRFIERIAGVEERLRALLRANMGEACRTHALLHETERKVEEQLGHLDFIETSWYVAGKKFRKDGGRDGASRFVPDIT